MHRGAEQVSHADVVVVGAGPAGATAARALAAAGVSTLLIDRSIFPRQKPCGGALSARVVTRFPYVREALPRITTHWISRLHLVGPSGASADLRSDSPAALMIRRVEFDALLVALAKEAGARVETGDVVAGRQHDAGVELTTKDGRCVRGRYVIACDGVHSVTARRLGVVAAWRRDDLAIDMMEETPNAALRARDPGSLWVRYGWSPGPANGSSPLWEGYGYVFPKRDHVNVGLGYLLHAYRQASPGPAYRSHQAFVDRLRVEGIVEGRSRREHFTPFLIPIAGPRRVLSKGRVLLGGDAAGFVHGLTAEGIYYAMVSGELAARTVVKALASSRPRTAPDLSGYGRAWRAEVGAELRESILLQRYLFASPDRVDAVIAAAAREGAAAQAAVRYLAGQELYRTLRARLVARNPGIVLALAADAVARLWRSVRP